MPDVLTNRWTLRALGLIAMGKAFLRYTNPRRKSSGRALGTFYERTWREAAEQLGGTCVALGSEICEIQIGGQRTRVVHNVCAIDDPVTLAVLHDKPITHRILRDVGVPVPRHCVFTTRSVAKAAEFLRALGGDCVVKPAAGTGGGRGVTTGIRTTWQLARAAAAAAVYSDELLIEEQVEGENYRLLYLEGELVDAFVRRRPAVVGDGRSTVAKLVSDHNDQRLKSGTGISQVLLTVDLDMRRTLAKQGLSLRSVPEAGKQVVLKTAINENSGADNTTATHLLCRSIVEDGARAVRALGSRFAGIDLVTRDPSLPLAESGGVVIEVNGTPNLYYHYNKSDGVYPAAVEVLRRVLKDAPLPTDQRRAFTAEVTPASLAAAATAN
jgi:D-alanine-D-alanine ligase-like ATP-grasp enzyme